MISRWLISGLFVLTTTFALQAQTISVVKDRSHREVVPGTDGCDNPPLCHYYPGFVSWNDDLIKEYTYRTINGGNVVEFMNWRIVYPLNYDSTRTQKYPMIVMMHGAGESGRIWTGQYNYATNDVRFDNNGSNLIHGGQAHLNAVLRNPSLSNAFPGIVIWPQASYNGAWENGWNGGSMNETGALVTKIIDWLLINKNIDPDRVYTHGLSNGAKGTWEVATKRADLFAAILPMSGVGSDMTQMAPILNTTPLWLFQGGTDTNPRPQAAVDAIAALQAAGGNPRYTLYPNLGHGTWNTAYAEPDFFTWILSKSKKNIYVFGGDPNICAGNNLKLGFSANMLEYIWVKDNVEIPSSNNRFLTINQPGVYKVKYRRRITPKWEPNAWAESNPVTIGINPSTFSPVLTNTGSTVLPTLGGVSEELYLNAPNGYPTYYWFKDGNPTIPIQPASSQTSVNTVLIKNNQGNAGQAGNYTVKVLLPNGCPSEHSNAINVSFGISGPAAPNITSIQAISSTEIKIDWTNVANATGYEVWRYRPSAGGYPEEIYKRIITVPQGTLTFTNDGLRPAASYRYRIRAINSNGGTYSAETNPVTTTSEDNIPPTPPLNLTASNITDTQVTLSWDAATDNDVIYAYEVYSGSTLISTLIHPYSSWTVWNSSTAYPINSIVMYNGRFYKAKMAVPATGDGRTPVPLPAWSQYWEQIDDDVTDGKPSPLTTYTVTGLSPGTTYFFSVRALDFKNPNATDAQRNYSPLSEVVEVTTQGPVNGLVFKYYTHSGLAGGNDANSNQLAEPYVTTNGPNFNFANPSASANGQLVATGVISNFDISGAFTYQNTTDPNNFVYAFDGYLQVDQTGRYRFFTSSDDGSRLYIDANNNGTFDSNEVLNNDGAQGETQVALPSLLTSYFSLNAGTRYKIRVTYFENGGGNVLYVRYTRTTNNTNPSTTYPGTNGNIPNSWLYQTGTIITTYYLKTPTAGNDPTVNTAWTTSSNGIGGNTAPVGVFSNPNTIFVLANHTTVTISNPWTISGSGSKVVVGDGTAITINLVNAVNATMEAASNAIINVGHTTVPKFNVLHASSMVNFNTPGISIPSASYGNVNLAVPGQFDLSLSTTIIKGNLSIANGATTTGVSNNLTTLRIGGNLIVNNTSGNPFPISDGQQYSLIFTGGITHNVSLDPLNLVDPGFFSIQSDFGDIINFPGLNGRTFTVGSNQGGGLVLKGGSTLNLGNNHLNVTGRGTINPNNETGALNMVGGKFTLSSTATQNSGIFFTDGSTVTNFTSSTPVNNRNGLGSTVAVTNLVTVNGGELNAGEGYLMLKSTGDAANLTARIGPLVSNGAKVTGKIKMERYMSGEGRIYRYISSPVRNVTAADLQAFFPITGNFTGATVISGVTSNASMFHYNETLNPQYQQFPSVGGTNLETLQRGKGYTPFIREAGAATTWFTTGEPYQGNIPFTLTGGTGLTSNGWNLLGNPYPAPIQWTGNSTGGWTLSGVNSVIYIRENDSSIPGGFRWRSSDGSLGLPFDGTIAPGQAFWVRTTTANPTLIISESAKKITDGAFYREGAPENLLEITMKSTTAEDAAYIRFVDGATSAFDTNIDGVKQDNSYFNLSSLTSDGKPMAINLTTTNYCEQEIKLRTANTQVGTYELNINGSGSIISGDEVTFTDNFTQTQKVISDTEVYTFSITDDPASKADGRFTLRLKKPEVVLNQTLKTDAACEQSSPIIKVNNSQPGVTYQAFVDGVAISEDLTSIGGTLELAVNPALIEYGSTPAIIKAGFKSCNSFELPMTIAVQRDTLPVPEILMEPLKLIASTENANYTWYFNGEELEGQTGQELLAPEDGLYVVEVTRASCIKKSDTVDYAAGRITGIEKPNRLQQLYPNPTRDKVVITMEQPIDFPSIRVITTIGQSLQIQTTRISNESAEVDFTQLPTGLYLLQVNGQRYRVLKE